jgi:hypothetical protein
MSETVPAFWLPLLWRGLVALVLALPVLALNVWERSLDSETRFTPWLSEIQQALCNLPLLSFVFAGAFMLRHYSSSTKSFSRAQRASWVSVVVMAQVVFTVAAMCVGAFTKPNWLFGPAHPYLSLRSPDGQRTAYATRDCLLNSCSLDVHVQEGRQLTMRRIQHFSAWNGAPPSWLPDSSGVQVVDEKSGAKL